MDDQDRSGIDGGGAQDRPLGRGLEDVSHLFLSRRATPGPAPHRAGGGVTLLRPAPVTRERLAALMAECDGAVEDGLRTIDARVPCHPAGEIDLLAVDRTSRLAIVAFEATPADGLLLRAIGQFDWVVRNQPQVQRMYRGQPVDFSLAPRLFLVAPQFSPLLRTVARQITRPQIHWIRYHTVEVVGGPGILFEPLHLD